MVFNFLRGTECPPLTPVGGLNFLKANPKEANGYF